MRYSIALAACLLAASAAAQDIRVTDGDTIRIGDERIRFWGIDAPETRQSCDGTGETFMPGPDAREALATFMEQFDYCERVTTDQHGRSVSRCFMDNGTSINAAMVAAGWAWDYEQFSDGHYATEQAVAEQSGNGVWVMGCDAPWDWRRENN